MASHVHIQVVRTLLAPRDAAYAWLTDFEDADAERAGTVIEVRRVVERTKDRVIYEGETVMLGRRTFGRAEVTMTPPDRWVAHVTAGPRTGSYTHYHLVPDGDRSRLTVDYHFILDDPKRMMLLRLAKPLVRRELAKMWAGFASAMERERPS